MEILEYVKIADTSEIPAGKMKMIKAGKEEILIANVKDKYYAIGNKCTHAGGDLSKGSLDDNIVTCPRHGSKFDVTTGNVVSGPKILFLHPKIKNASFYEVKVEGHTILLRAE